MNFSPLGLMNKPTYQTLDEVEIAKQIESMEERENSHATADYESELFQSAVKNTYVRTVYATAGTVPATAVYATATAKRSTDVRSYCTGARVHSPE